MRVRFPLIGLCLLGAAIAMALAMRSLPTHGSSSAAPTSLPTVQIDFPARPMADLFRSEAAEEGKDYVPVQVTDGDGGARLAKATLRGFSAWHHGTTKPSLRIKQKEVLTANQPEFVELSRPEDPLALCNWLPDQLAEVLGLLHERSRHVVLQLDGRNAGIYLQSLRPGDDLAAAAGRARGTFCKGDCLGERRHLDLWSSAAAWRSTGAADPFAQAALNELLAALRAPASAPALDRLATVFDLEVAARCAAIAVLVSSIHADRAHNHVFFFDPARGRLEPLLWDANGFGIHAEPELPVEVARHPLAERLLGDVRFVQRRNQILWDLLHGAGSVASLTGQVDQLLARFGTALDEDPETVRLVLRKGVFETQRVDGPQRRAARDEFAAFVQRRVACLFAHFDGARAAITRHPDNPAWSVVTVFGTVAVRLERQGPGEVRSPDGDDATLLWPGLTERLVAAPQHRAMDGRGVAAPHALPAPLAYTVAVEPAALRCSNAFTGESVPSASLAMPADGGLRSVHPWQRRAAPRDDVHLGPGDVLLEQPLVIGADATLFVAAGTTLVLRGDARIHCRGSLVAIGTDRAPISIHREGGCTTAIECVGSARVHLAHLTLHDATPWSSEGPPPSPLLALRGCTAASLEHCLLRHATGDGIAVVGGTCHLSHTTVHGSHGTGLSATSCTVTGEHCEFAFGSVGVLARDGAGVDLRGGRLRGNLVGVRAQRSARPFAGGRITLDAVACADNGQFDLDADAFGTIELVATNARSNPLAVARVRDRSQPPAAPR